MDQDAVTNQSDSGDNTADPEPPQTRSKKGKRGKPAAKKTPVRKTAAQAKAEAAAASPKVEEPEVSSPKVSSPKVGENLESTPKVEKAKEAIEEEVEPPAEVQESSAQDSPKGAEGGEGDESKEEAESVVVAEEEVPADVQEEEVVMEEVQETEVVEMMEEPAETKVVQPQEEETIEDNKDEGEEEDKEPVKEEAKEEKSKEEVKTKKEEKVAVAKKQQKEAVRTAKKLETVAVETKKQQKETVETAKKQEETVAVETKKQQKETAETAKKQQEADAVETTKKQQEADAVETTKKLEEAVAVETTKKQGKEILENSEKNTSKETEDNSKKNEDAPELPKRKRKEEEESPDTKKKVKVSDEDTPKKKLEESETPENSEKEPKKNEVASVAEMDEKPKKSASLVDVPETEPVSEDGGDSNSESEGPLSEMVTVDEVTGDDEVKEPLETEAVSDEEFPAAVDLPETEAVSEDELPPEKNEKKKESPIKSTVSSDSSTRKKRTRSKIKSEGQKRKLVDGDTYDPGSPTSENSEEETPSKRPATAGKVKSVVVVKKALSELDKYWKAVKEDPTDFTGWTYLLQYVDQENDIEAAREAYDAFLSHYPYCYGYWRKYADYEKRKGNKDKCENVFERGLKAIPLSVDLWIHYLNYMKATYPDDEQRIRSQFEKGIEACGMEFRSDRLWDNFIKWEAENKKLQNVTNLYDRLLAIPTQGYTNHFETFQEHISNNPPQKVLSVDEFLTLRREVLQVLKQYEQPLAMEDKVPGEEEEVPPGEESEEQPVVKSDEETTALRERIVSLRRKVHKNTVTMVAERWNYEEAIKRPYFHVKPLERSQLKNWKEYLDFEIERGDQERIIVLFERCLIACALYEEFWIKFIRYLEGLKSDMTDKIRNVYERACLIHHTKKPNLHLHWAAFEESKKNYQKASEILTKLEENFPNMLQIAYRRINLERRWDDYDKVCALYEHYINISKNKIIANNMAIKYARFCWKIKGDVEKAISILNKAVEKDKENPRLFLQLIDMGLQKSPVNEKEIVGIIDQFLAGDSELEQKVLFAQRKVEFLEDFGTDVLNVQRAHEEFQKFFKMAKDRKKRSTDFEKLNAESASKKQKSGGADAAQNHTSSHASSQSPHGSASSQQPPQPSSATAATGPYPPPAYTQNGGYSQQPPTAAASGYQGSQYPAAGSATQPPAPYNQQYNQQYSQSSDPNYANYQGWGYSQTGYGGYNQGWGNYNYY